MFQCRSCEYIKVAKCERWHFLDRQAWRHSPSWCRRTGAVWGQYMKWMVTVFPWSCCDYFLKTLGKQHFRIWQILIQNAQGQTHCKHFNLLNDKWTDLLNNIYFNIFMIDFFQKKILVCQVSGGKCRIGCAKERQRGTFTFSLSREERTPKVCRLP